MSNTQIHRLLKRQLRKVDFTPAEKERFQPFLDLVNDAYIAAELDFKHLEDILELSSKELFKANKELTQENQLKSKEALLYKAQMDIVMANVSDIIFKVNEDGNFTYLNDAWVNFSNLSPEESLGMNFMDFSDTIKYFDLEALKKIENRDFVDLNTTFSRYDAEAKLKWWEMSTKLILDEQNNIKGAIGSLIDVSLLKESQLKLQKASSAKSQFLSTMSHEIRTPLNAVVAISDLLLKNNPKESQLENLNALQFSSTHLLSLVNDILDYNKLISDNIQFDNSVFNVREVIKGVIATFSFLARDKGIELKMDLAPCVPESIKGDRVRLAQVLNNLVSNAVKFTKEGQVSLQVSCQNRNVESANLKFEIQDTGIGIEEENIESIFERFTQANTSTKQIFGGTGLGLSISKKIVELQGGNIDVESTYGHGSTFYFELPFQLLEETKIEDLKQEDVTDTLPEGIKILAVDDNELNLLVISQYLELWNIPYDTALDGKQACEMLTKSDYSLILMDLQMPVMDGYEASSEIRKLKGVNSTIPIIALSASVSSDIIKKVTEAHMDDYMSKPFDPDVLFEKIAFHCKRTHVQAATASS